MTEIAAGLSGRFLKYVYRMQKTGQSAGSAEREGSEKTYLEKRTNGQSGFENVGKMDRASVGQ